MFGSSVSLQVNYINLRASHYKYHLIHLAHFSVTLSLTYFDRFISKDISCYCLYLCMQV